MDSTIQWPEIRGLGQNWLTDLMERQGVVAAKLGHKHSTYEALVGTGVEEVARAAGIDVTGYFCVVRNPISWYESWYKYQCHRDWRQWGMAGNLSRWHVMAGLNMNKPLNFNDFMERVNQQIPGFVTQLFSRYVLGAQSYVLKIETIRVNLVQMCRESGLVLDDQEVLRSPKLGVSPETEVWWDPFVKRVTVESELAAFRAYGYDPDESLHLTNVG